MLVLVADDDGGSGGNGDSPWRARIISNRVFRSFVRLFVHRISSTKKKEKQNILYTIFYFIIFFCRPYNMHSLSLSLNFSLIPYFINYYRGYIRI